MRSLSQRAAAPALLATVSTFALLTAAPAFAQSAEPVVGEAAQVDDIVVTGTRVQNRSRLDTLAPVDVVTSEALQTRGTTEFATAVDCAAQPDGAIHGCHSGAARSVRRHRRAVFPERCRHLDQRR